MNSAAIELDASMAICSNMVINGVCAQFGTKDVFLHENVPIVEYGGVAQK
jgi:hypothetical protein